MMKMQFLKFILYKVIYITIIISCLFILYLFLYKFLKVPFIDQSLIFFMSAWHFFFFFCYVIIVMKKTKLVWVLCVWTIFHWTWVLQGVFSFYISQSLNTCHCEKYGHKLGECQTIIDVPLKAFFGYSCWRLMAW